MTGPVRFPGRRAGLFFLLLMVTGLLLPWRAEARRMPLAPVPAAVASNHFVVTIDGQSTPVMHAAMNLYFLNFTAHKHMHITVTASADDFWNAGVDVQPWRLGIRPKREGRVLRFTLDGPAKVSISRPNEAPGDAEMLYLFANAPVRDEPKADGPGLRYIGPGVHEGNIDAVSGESIYLAAGAVVMGALNVWQVDHVKVFGPGVIVYDGPQNPADDDGWMHKRNWHCITMDAAHDITIADLTCVVRSRTWQIQMKDSHGVVFDNVKVIGANPGNANADGMDWLGGGDTVVRNSFFRAADDVFALQTSWEGYGAKAFAVQGEPVRNVLIEHTEVSTSISNIVRVGWPGKNFEGGGLRLNDIDVLHAGIGGCGVPFALFELWATPDGRGSSADYSFEHVRLDDWYSLLSVEQPTPVTGIRFTDVASLRTPASVPSELQGAVSDVVLDNVVLAGKPVGSVQDVPLLVRDGAEVPLIRNTGPQAQVRVSGGWLRPGQKVRFEATTVGDDSDVRYTWIFGDGSKAHGRRVKHRFADADGTLLDGSGLFDVLLHMKRGDGRETWVGQPFVVRESMSPAEGTSGSAAGVAYTLTSGGGAPESGVAKALALSAVPHPAKDYELGFTGMLDVPADGGYVFTVVANEASTFSLDGKQLASSPAPFAQVCGLAGYAARVLRVPAVLARGPHRLDVLEKHSAGVDDFKVLWQGPGVPLQPVPAALLREP